MKYNAIISKIISFSFMLLVLAMVMTGTRASARTIVCNGSYTYTGDVVDKTIEIYGGSIGLQVAGNMEDVSIVGGSICLEVQGDFIGEIYAQDLVVVCWGFAGRIESLFNCSLYCSLFYGPKPKAEHLEMSVVDDCQYIEDEGWGSCGGDDLDEIYVIKSPRIVATEGSVSDGSVDLKWDSDTYGLTGFTYDLYRGTNYAHALTQNLAPGLTSTQFHVPDHFTYYPEAPSLTYVVVTKYQGKEVARGSCTLRNRRALSIGFSNYGRSDVEGIPSALEDAKLFHSLALANGQFRSSTLLTNNVAKKESVRQMLNSLANWYVLPGDIFVLYVATHGGTSSSPSDDAYSMALYDLDYSITELREDLSAFSTGAMIVPIIMTCHSGAVLTEPDNGAFCNKVSGCGDNVAWIVSCNDKQVSVSNERYSAFGEEYLENGWNHGFADRTLYGVSTYSGGNSDGFVSFLELARYAQVFSRGKSQLLKSTVGWESMQETILARTIIGRAGTHQGYSRPSKPVITASLAEYDDKTMLQWTAVPEATRFQVIRQTKTDPVLSVVLDFHCTERELEDMVGANIQGRRMYSDSERFKVYDYRVRAINPQGIGPWSDAAPGSRGVSDLFFGSKLVPWLMDKFPRLLPKFGYNCETAALALAANGRSVWDCCVADLDPEDPNANLIAGIEVLNGKPKVSITRGKSQNRVYTVQGLKSIGDDWCDLDDQGDWDADGYRFFRVKASFPE